MNFLVKRMNYYLLALLSMQLLTSLSSTMHAKAAFQITPTEQRLGAATVLEAHLDLLESGDESLQELGWKGVIRALKIARTLNQSFPYELAEKTESIVLSKKAYDPTPIRALTALYILCPELREFRLVESTVKRIPKRALITAVLAELMNPQNHDSDNHLTQSDLSFLLSVLPNLKDIKARILAKWPEQPTADDLFDVLVLSTKHGLMYELGCQDEVREKLMQCASTQSSDPMILFLRDACLNELEHFFSPFSFIKQERRPHVHDFRLIFDTSSQFG